MASIGNGIDNRSWTRGVLSALLWAVVAVVVLVWVVLLAIIFVFTVPSDPGRYTVGLWFRRAAVVIVRLNPLWHFRTSGVVIRDPRRPYIAVANHESYADIFLISHLPWEMKWLSKAEVMRLPLMGWLMRMAGDIPVHRGDSRSRAEAMNGIRDRLAKRVSVIVLPEGTRAPTDQLLPFRDGAFRVAVELGLPVLPIAVAGTRNAMAKGSFRFNRATAEARVLEPIETTGMTREDVPRLRDEVRNRIDAAREELRRELASAK
ncbi:MAG TPA: lysophospholipid acyltransferase family protein [Longimicrobiales bacterium]|nr:lysophospholipid acyltransferase family protein [Longimicrobiales bacterium]